ncbi:MAG: hypothetical protein ABJD97_15505 [Betaproteobacteria bacterium]
MRFVLALLLLTAATLAHAQDGAPTVPCAQPVRFLADWFADPPLDLAKSATNLVELGAPAGVGATALGLVTVENAISVKPETACRGLRVQLQFLHPVLRVARELPPGTCAHAHVLRHEYTHVRIYREMARQFQALAYPWPDKATPDAVLHFARQQLAKMQEAQRLFDSPEEYAGNATACKGEILQLLTLTRPPSGSPTP